MVTRFTELLAEPRTLVMGVLNITPDSFSDGGKFLGTDAALLHARKMLAEGADIIDIGGQSTRPPGSAYGAGAEDVTLEEELRRVISVVQALSAEHPEAIISIDTTKAETARKAVEAGACIINDVSGATQDTAMLEAARSLAVPIILMHGYGPEFQKANIEEYHYDDVVAEVFTWLHKRIEAAWNHGVSDVLADIGFGFAKTSADNIKLLAAHKAFKKLNVPMLVGVSRKSTIGKILGGIPPQERLSGSVAAALYAAQHGAKIVRTHDVLETKQALTVWEAFAS